MAMNTVNELLRERVRLDGPRGAFRVKTRGRWVELTWNEIYEKVSDVARGLKVLGLRTGDKVVLCCSTRLEWVVCDLAVITCAASAEPEGKGLRGLRIAMGGLSPHARRFPEIESLFNAASLPAKAEIEALVSPLFTPSGDARGSSGFKRLRAAALLADVLVSLEEGGL